MKFFATFFALALCVAVVSAAPHHGSNNRNDETNYNKENNSNHQGKEITQDLGNVGSSSSGGLLGGNILGGGLLSSTETTNNVGQNAKIN